MAVHGVKKSHEAAAGGEVYPATDPSQRVPKYRITEGEWDPRHATKAARTGMREVVAERMRQFGQAGHAADYVPLSLERMRERYVATAAVA